MKWEWGLLGPETLSSERRIRILGIGAAVRAVNERAVPGMGNVFFGKQIVLALIGVAVAAKVSAPRGRVRNIETANAIEALACWLAHEHGGWVLRDARLRGGNKMRGQRSAPTFAEARKRGFYVTQPLRTATVQPLYELNLVESNSERFNAFALGEKGMALLEVFCEAWGPIYRSRNVIEQLVAWASETARGVTRLTEALSPVEPLPPITRGSLRDCIIGGDTEGAWRRRAILKWMDRLPRETSESADWADKPQEVDDAHWQDLEAGAHLLAARAAAFGLLDSIEKSMRDLKLPRLELGGVLADSVKEASLIVAQKAQQFLALEHDPTPGKLATAFCRECIDGGGMIEKLVTRDGRILRLAGRAVVPGPAFEVVKAIGHERDDDDTAPGEEDPQTGLSLPPGISHRVANMFVLNLDLNGAPNEWFGAQS
jgi:hypothetical protein